TVNHLGFSGMAASLSLLLEHGGESIERHILALTGILSNGLAAIDGVKLISPTNDPDRAGIVTIDPPHGVNASNVFKKLLAKNIVISLREGKLRYSPHFYNSPEEIRKAVEATKECCG
ncbi:MAG TPA: aminotransferase class V-fold PLP-dependent enzyme, partial [Bacteroidota bacterium]|nr:aminotransferase class V-fold PLP-dependent enzyme [Bacteroidota bacterium]